MAGKSFNMWAWLDPSSNLKTFVIYLMLSQKRIQNWIKIDSNLYQLYDNTTCVFAYLRIQKVREQGYESIKRGYLWIRGSMTIILLSFFWGGMLISKSLKLIHITLNSNFFSHYTGNFCMHFHCKNPNNILPSSIGKQINIIKGKNHYF